MVLHSWSYLSNICFQTSAIAKAVFTVKFNLVTLNNFYALLEIIIVYMK